MLTNQVGPRLPACLAINLKTTLQREFFCPYSSLSSVTVNMPSATGSSWEKYKKEFADDEIEEKKITPLSDEYVAPEALEYGHSY